MNNPIKPLTDAYTKNKTLALIIIIAALGLLIYFEGKAFLSWLNGKITAGGKAVVDAGNKALGNIGNQDLGQSVQTIEDVGNYYVSIATDPTNAFNSALYTANAAASNLTFDQLSSVAGAVKDSLMKGILGIIYSNGSAIAFKNALAPCLSQTDVSNVCIVYKQLYSADMAYAVMRDYTSSLCNLFPDTDGNDNNVNLSKAIVWIQSLPKS